MKESHVLYLRKNRNAHGKSDKRLLFQKIRRKKREFKTKKQIICDENGNLKLGTEEVAEV